ncbi:MAG: glycoside hydrolase family 28 protein [Burkholderiales bacterium]|nr:glycoside hydrolase family 28 protein [Burkholderiales bacterium]
MPTAASAPRLDARAFGARGDGQTLDTQALQSAIDAAAGSGGTLDLPPGSYLTGALFLKSGLTLQLARGATLLGSPQLHDYPVLPTRVSGIEMPWPAALVNIVGQHDVALVGEGTIDGDGARFWASYWALRKRYAPRGLRWAADFDCQRPRLVQVYESRRVRIGDGLLLRRSGFWTLHLCYSRQVVVDGLTIRNNEDGRGPSTDGIGIDSSRQVLVRRADISVNDDAIVFKAGRDADGLRVARPTEDVLVRDCIVRDGAAGVTFGSETSGGFRRILVRGLKVLAPVPVGILFKSTRTRGGFARHLRLHDIDLAGVAVVARITLDWNPSFCRVVLPPDGADPPAHWRTLARPAPPGQGLMRVGDVRISRLRARGASTAFEVDADPGAPLEDFVWRHVDIEARDGGQIRDARHWRFDDCRLRWPSDRPLRLAEPGAIVGLPAGRWRHEPGLKPRDISSLSDAEQDVL